MDDTQHETETLADPIGTTAADEGTEGTAADGAEGPEGFSRVAVARRISELRRRGIEVDEWLAEEFTQIERQLQQLRDARLKGKQPIIWMTTAKDVMDAFDRGIIKDRNEARAMFGLKALKKIRRPQPEGLRRHAEARRAAQS